MAAPIILRQVGRAWEVLVDVPLTRRRALRQTPAVRVLPDEIVPIARNAEGKLDLIPGAKPERFKTKEDARHVAGMVGQYKLGLGQMLYAYVEEQREVRGERDRRSRR